MGTTPLWRKLMQFGVSFRKMPDSMWIAEYEGQRIARKLTLGDAVWQAAEALGE